MKLAIRIFSSAAIVLGIAALFVTSGCGSKPEEKAEVVRPVKTVLVNSPQAYVRNYPGRVQAGQRVEMAFRNVSGPLIELPVKEGDRVEQGQLLAKIDPRDYKIAYSEAKAEFEKTESDYKRYVNLYEEDAVPLADLELYRARRDVAKSRLDDATAALNDTELQAPFEGLIGERFVENFQEVRAQEPILSLHDISYVEVVTDLPEGLVAVMEQKGDDPYELYATFDPAPGKEYPVKVKEFAANADPTTQTYRATFVMPQPTDILVLPGMTSSIKAVMKPGAKTAFSSITIPSSAVFKADDGKDTVWLVDPNTNKVHAKEVEVGALMGNNDIRILSGIVPGNRVVTAGANMLREGMSVRVIDDRNAKIVE